MGWWLLYLALMIITMGGTILASKNVWVTAIVGAAVSVISLFALLIGLIP